MKNRSIWLFCLLAPSLQALPTDLQIAAGKADLTLSSPETLEILASDQAILNWKDFSIGSNERVTFIQPDTSSCVLNRVLGANPSQLLGSMHANGKVLLLNPNGILVGKNAYIDTGSFLASTLDLNNDVFLTRKDFIFEGQNAGSIVNLGEIHGEVFLAAPKVEHLGIIRAGNNKVVLFSPSPNKEVQLTVDNVSFLFKSEHDSYFSETKVTGAIQGKDIYVLGDLIEVSDEAKIDASGSHGGGHIYVGGGKQGQNPNIANATQTRVAPGARLTAHALEHGHGGEVIVWSDEATFFYGHSAAEGGKLSGNGGFLEVSGRYLDFRGTVSTLAPNGEAGMLLLDPGDIGISETQPNFAVSGLPLGPVFSPTGGTCLGCPACTITATTSNLTKTSLLAALAVTNVTVDTTCGGCVCFGDIFVDNSLVPVVTTLTWVSGNSLTLNAARDIIIEGSIQDASPAVFAVATPRVTLNAGRDIIVRNTTVAGGGGPMFPAPYPGSTGSLSVGSQFAGTLVTAGGDISVIGGNPAAGQFSAQIGFYTMTEAPPGTFTLTGTSSGPITIVNGRDLNLLPGPGTFVGVNGHNGAQIGHGAPNILVFTGRSGTSTTTTLGPLGLVTPDINITTTRNVTLNSNGFDCWAKIGHGSITLDSTLIPSSVDQIGDIRVCAGGDVHLDGSTSSLDETSIIIGHGGILYPGPPPSAAGPPGTATLTGNITVQGTSVILTGTTSYSGSQVMIGHGGEVINAGTIQCNGNITVTATNGPVTLTGGSDGILPGTSILSSTHIGHGIELGFDMNFPSGNLLTAVGNITVTSSLGNDITITTLPSFLGDNEAGIGHWGWRGYGTLPGRFPPGNLTASGDININCGRNLRLDCFTAGDSSPATIGHRSNGDTRIAVIATLVTASGDINIQVPNGGITLIASPTAAAGGPVLFAFRTTSDAIIGHGGTTAVDATVSGNMNICCRDDIDMTAGAAGSSAKIGHDGTFGSVSNGTYRITVGGNLNQISPGPSDTNNCYIGGFSSPLPPFFSSLTFNNMILEMSVCQNVTMTTPGPNPPFFTSGVLGFGFATFGAATTSCFVAVRGNITSNATKSVQMTSQGGDFNMAVMGGMSATALGPFGQTSIGADNAGNTNLFVGGNFLLSQIAGGTMFFPFNLFPGTFSAALDLRAGGDIQLASPIGAPTSPILIRAGHGFAPGELWTAALATIALQTVPGGLPLCCLTPAAVSVCSSIPAGAPICPCTVFASPSPVNIPSCGAFYIQPPRPQPITAVGDLFISGQCVSCLLGLQSLSVGPGVVDDINVTFMPGNNVDFLGFQDINIHQIINVPGHINLQACHDNNIDFPITSGTTISTCAGNDTNVRANVTAVGDILMVSGHDMTIFSPFIVSSSAGNITLVVDNNFPARPLRGPGAFTLELGASVIAALKLRIFTALQGLNSIQGTLNASNFMNGTLYVDTPQEHWCTYFPGTCFNANIAGFFVNPNAPDFTVFYKDCLQQTTNQALIVVSEFNLHPYDEYPGWAAIAWITGTFDGTEIAEPYMLRRRQLNFLNHPKTWSQLTRGRWAPLTTSETTSDRYHWTGYKMSGKEDEI